MKRILLLSLIPILLLSLIPSDGVFSDEPFRGSGPKPTSKIDFGLASLASTPDTSAPITSNQDTVNSLQYIPMSDGFVVIDAVAAENGESLLNDLQTLGLQNGVSIDLMVSGRLPVSSINAMAELDSLQFARPAYMVTSAGIFTSEGDKAMNADDARTTFGVDGSGVTVGVLSDSFDCDGGASDEVDDGDLPSGITVLEEGCPGSDEGRAMMQIIHDVAPGSSQMFHTAAGGIANFAQGIRDLADAGADVIVDDVVYLAEPMFQDGAIAQAVDDVVTNDDVAYFSSAGNNGRNSYEATFASAGTFDQSDFPSASGAPAFRGGTVHDFGGGSFLQRINIPTFSGFLISFQWDSPFFSTSGNPGTTNDVDIYLLDDTGRIVAGGATNNITSKDAVEIFGVTNFSADTEFDLMISHSDGGAPGTIKYILFPFGTTNVPGVSGSTIFGHTNAANAESVGASFHSTPLTIESFSSAGPTPILFDTDGDPIPGGETRNKPNIVAPDGVSTSVPGFSTFFGTSAAAPHAAGVAALMLETLPDLDPDELYAFLHSTATDMDDPSTGGFDTGFDFGTGFGFIQADDAVEALQPTLTLTKQSSRDPAFLGELLTYTMLVTNTGTEITDSVILTDTLPSDVSFDSAATNVGSFVQSGNTITFNLGNLAPGQIASSTITVIPTALGTLPNIASVTSDTPITNTLHATVTEDTLVNPALTLTKQDSPDPAILGESLTYTLLVNNLGSATTTNVTIDDTLPVDTNFVSATSTAGVISQSGNTVTFSLGDLAAGQIASSTITVIPTALGTLTNNATLSSGSPTPDVVHTTVTEDTLVNPAVTISKTATPPSLTVGGVITYSLQIEVEGLATSTNVTIVDTFTPANIGSISATSTSATIQQVGNEITLSFGDLSPGTVATSTVSITTAVSATLTNTATVYTDNPSPSTAHDSVTLQNVVNTIVSAPPPSSSSSGGGGGGGGAVRRQPREIVPSDEILIFTGTIGRRSPDRQFLSIRNGGSFILRWSVSTNENWLKLRPTFGEADSNDLLGRVEVSVDTTGLEAGTHVGKIIIAAASDTTINSPLEVEVILELISPEPEFSPEDLEGISPQEAADFLSELDDEERTAFFEEIQIDELDQIIQNIDEDELIAPLANLSLSKFRQLPAMTRLAALASIPAEQITDEETPEVDPTIPSVITSVESANMANYLVSETSDAAWTPLVASPEPIEGILGRFNKRLNDVSVEVETLNELPSGVPVLPDNQLVNSLFRIELDGAENNDIDAAHITFTVDKSWLLAQGIHKWSIQLHRFDEQRQEWVTFQSKRIAESEEDITYTAVTPGFSLFAITGDTDVTPSNMKVTNLQVVPTVPVENQIFLVRVGVQNIGTSEAVIPVSLWVDNTIEQSTIVVLGEREMTTVSFGLSKPEGQYEVRVDRLISQIVVEEAEDVFVLAEETATPMPSLQVARPTATNTPTPVPTPTPRATVTPTPVPPTPTATIVIPTQTVTPTPTPSVIPTPTVQIDRIARASVPIPSPESPLVPLQDGDSTDSDDNPGRLLVFLLILMAVGISGGVATFSRFYMERRRTSRPPHH